MGNGIPHFLQFPKFVPSPLRLVTLPKWFQYVPILYVEILYEIMVSGVVFNIRGKGLVINLNWGPVPHFRKNLNIIEYLLLVARPCCNQTWQGKMVHLQAILDSRRVSHDFQIYPNCNYE